MPTAASTTYIFGAGASRHAGYPFANTMGKELLQWMKTPREQVYFDYPGNAEYLEQRFGDDIEALMKGIQRAIRNHEHDFTMMVNFYKPSLVQAIREWFGEIHQRDQGNAYEVFASRIIKPGDCVITFNYDVSLDSHLRKAGKWSVGDGYGFSLEGLPQDSQVKLLKLHGSINWLAVLFGGLTGGPFTFPSAGAFGTRPAISDGDLSALGYENVIDPMFPRMGAPAVPPMILPTNRKQFFFQTNLGREWGTFWTRLWSIARKAVRTSDHVVICGYGFFPIDRRGCNLLLKGELPGAVEVCSGSRTETIVAELRAHGRNANAAAHLYFEDWVNSR